MNDLKITKIRIKDNRIIYVSNIPMKGVPESIAVLPALGTLLPLSWLFDASLDVDELDADFLSAIPQIKQGYMNMYPSIEFKGTLDVLRPVENVLPDAKGTMSLFSGGLDSHDTVLRHADEKPALLIYRGADISIKKRDEQGWEEILRQVDELASALGSERISVETNMRDAMNYRFLNKWTSGIDSAYGTYWYNFQHGLALTLHAAPVAWQKKYAAVYIASSYTQDDEGKTTCASDPSIDNCVHFFGTRIIHDGYEYTRNAKLDNVAAWVRKNNHGVFLRVCHSRPKVKGGGVQKNGRNCCACEKCYRTILGLYAIKEDPANYGFDYGDDFDAFGEEIRDHAFRMIRMFNLRYLPIIKKLRENYTRDEVSKGLLWLYDFKLDENSELFKWIDKRVVIEHEKAMAADIQYRKLKYQTEKQGIIGKVIGKLHK